MKSNSPFEPTLDDQTMRQLAKSSHLWNYTHQMDNPSPPNSNEKTPYEELHYRIAAITQKITPFRLLGCFCSRKGVGTDWFKYSFENRAEIDRHKCASGGWDVSTFLELRFQTLEPSPSVPLMILRLYLNRLIRNLSFIQGQLEDVKGTIFK
jgi:hypothetical protein